MSYFEVQLSNAIVLASSGELDKDFFSNGYRRLHFEPEFRFIYRLRWAFFLNLNFFYFIFHFLNLSSLLSLLIIIVYVCRMRSLELHFFSLFLQPLIFCYEMWCFYFNGLGFWNWCFFRDVNSNLKWRRLCKIVERNIYIIYIHMRARNQLEIQLLAISHRFFPAYLLLIRDEFCLYVWIYNWIMWSS